MSEAYQSTPRPTTHAPYVKTLNRGSSSESYIALCPCGWHSGLPFNRYGFGLACNVAREHADGVRR